MPDLREVPLDAPAWGWKAGDIRNVEYAGRRCIAFSESVDLIATVADAALTDGAIEIDMAVTGERAFHGVVWRLLDDETYESFYVRPHQVRNPDSVQYNPVFNGISSWQLYHDEGFWAAVDFPIGEWFTVRLVFAGSRAEVFIGDTTAPALEATELKMPVTAGSVGILIGGPGLLVSRFAYSDAPAAFVGVGRAPAAAVAGIVPAWAVSDAFPEPDSPPAQLPPAALANRTWTRLHAEPSGLVNLSIANGIRDGRNTAWARTTIHATRSGVRPMHLGFSDRAVVYLNGAALYRGDDSYRSRDYRFLGSIGWYDTIYLPLAEGPNDLLVAVSEDFGGWGIQARFDSLDGIRLRDPTIQQAG
jgi:hypothetical protein